MKFRYVGKEEGMEVFGYDFKDGATPDVKEDFFIRKLSGNSHFEAIMEKEKKAFGAKAATDADDKKAVSDPDDKTEWPV